LLEREIVEQGFMTHRTVKCWTEKLTGEILLFPFSFWGLEKD